MPLVLNFELDIHAIQASSKSGSPASRVTRVYKEVWAIFTKCKIEPVQNRGNMWRLPDDMRSLIDVVSELREYCQTKPYPVFRWLHLARILENSESDITDKLNQPRS